MSLGKPALANWPLEDDKSADNAEKEVEQGKERKQKGEKGKKTQQMKKQQNKQKIGGSVFIHLLFHSTCIASALLCSDGWECHSSLSTLWGEPSVWAVSVIPASAPQIFVTKLKTVSFSTWLLAL